MLWSNCSRVLRSSAIVSRAFQPHPPAAHLAAPAGTSASTLAYQRCRPLCRLPRTAVSGARLGTQLVARPTRPSSRRRPSHARPAGARAIWERQKHDPVSPSTRRHEGVREIPVVVLDRLPPQALQLALDLAPGVAGRDVAPLVSQLLAARERELDLDLAALEVEPRRDEREALLRDDEASRSISFRWRRSLRGRSGSWLARFPSVYSGTWRPTSHASPSRTSAYACCRVASPPRSDFTSVPVSTTPASTRSERWYSCRARRLSTMSFSPLGLAMEGKCRLEPVELTLAQLNEIGAGHLPGLIGVVADEVGADAARAHLDVEEKHWAPNGYLHAATVVGLPTRRAATAASSTCPTARPGSRRSS